MLSTVATVRLLGSGSGLPHEMILAVRCLKVSLGCHLYFNMGFVASFFLKVQ